MECIDFCSLNNVSNSTVTATFSWLAPKHQAFRTHSQAAWCLGTNLRAYRTALHAGLNYNRRCTSGRKPIPEEANAIGDSRKKNDRDRSTLTTGYSLRVQNSRRSIPGKIWMSTNQIRAIVARAHVYRQILARAPQASQGI